MPVPAAWDTSTVLKKSVRNLKGVGTFSLLTVNTLLCFVPLLIFAVVKLLLPFTASRRVLTRWIMRIGDFWVACNARIFGISNDTQWDVRGAEGLSRDKWYLLISNHQTWTDILVLQTVMNRRIPFLKFFIKQQLMWFPVLGIAWWAMDMPFMKRYSKSYLAKHPEKKGRDLDATRAACAKFTSTPTTVINFIEGTRFTEEKRIKRASPFEHLLPPRAGGIALALTSMGEMFDAILDVTIVYPEGVAQFWDLCCGEFESVTLVIKKHSVENWMVTGDYSNDREFRREFHQWLTTLWERKDELISALAAETSESARHIA